MNSPLPTPKHLKISKSLTYRQSPRGSRLNAVPKRPVGPISIIKRGYELSLCPSSPNRYTINYLPASPRGDSSFKHMRSSTTSSQGFKFIRATEQSPIEEFQTPSTATQTLEVSDDLLSNFSIGEEPKKSGVYLSPMRIARNSFNMVTAANSAQKSFSCEKLEKKASQGKDIAEKASMTTRMTTHSIDEIRGNESEFMNFGKRIYCDKCKENVDTEILVRTAQKSWWDKLISGVCCDASIGAFNEIVHLCIECGNEVARIKYKYDESC